MAAASGIFHHSMATANPLTSAKPMDTSGAGSSAGDASTISANDFLTLLVTEMKNQDPTANTDPNEYINQLVQVNSLEQLININQNISTALGSGSAGTPAAGVVNAAGPAGSPALETSGGTTAQPAAPSALVTSRSIADNSHARTVGGNLNVPSAQPAAQRVAQALGGRS